MMPNEYELLAFPELGEIDPIILALIDQQILIKEADLEIE
tara:strand:+ start:577 stop:696 length:120 start_codon:yes stop_codon:yes gene_type:complete